MDEIDLIFQDQPTIEPRDGFAERVLREVRAEHRSSVGLRFPWRRLIGGLAACVIVAALAMPGLERSQVLHSAPLPAMWAVIAVLVTVVFIRLMLDWAET